MYQSKSLILITALFLLSSCVSKSKFVSLEKAHHSLKEQLDETNRILNTTQEEKAQLSMSSKQLRNDLKSLKEKLNFTESMMESLKTAESKSVVVPSKKLNEAPNMNLHEKSIEPSVVRSSLVEYDYFSSDESINFYSGSIIITQEDKESLMMVAKQFIENPEVKFVIEGHADHRPVKKGSRFKDNWDLSTQRAQSVAQILIEFGVNPAQFTVLGKSDTEPLVTGFALSPEELAKNRRVEIIPQSFDDADQYLQQSSGPTVF